ncbi:hypothetical protein E4U10_006838 [Claviceps purpurea]|nr:hypothetical protein E4U10_006838 [Claviceps purpurea]
MANDITQTLAKMQQTLTTLMSKMTALENGRVESEATRNNREQSAFSDQGKTFVPKGMAAKAVFKKYPGGEMKNPDLDYCDKAKARARDLKLFMGDASKFDSWITAFSDKIQEDDCTFRRESSRMMFLFSCLESDGAARRTVETRYQ